MGDMLVKIFDVVYDIKGSGGRIMLAEKSGVSKASAAQIEDKPDIVKKVKDEASAILGESIDKYLINYKQDVVKRLVDETYSGKGTDRHL